MTYLVDANVLSELTKPIPSEKVVEWFRNVSDFEQSGVKVVDPFA